MSGAGKPASTVKVRKFMFDRSFDVIEPKKKKEEEAAEAKAEEKTEPEVVAPTFSEEEMQSARDEAFAQGKTEGAAEAKASTEREIKVALGGIAERLAGLSEAQNRANASVLETGIIVAAAIARKLLPAFAERHALDEIERMVSLALERVLEEPKVIVYVNSKLKAPLEQRVGDLATKAGFKGELAVEGVDDIIVGDCNVEWHGGGARRKMEELWHEIDEVLEHNLADDTKTAAAVATKPVDSDAESAAVEAEAGGAILEGQAADEAPPKADAVEAAEAPEAAGGTDAAGERDAGPTSAPDTPSPTDAPEPPADDADDTATDREDR